MSEYLFGDNNPVMLRLFRNSFIFNTDDNWHAYATLALNKTE